MSRVVLSIRIQRRLKEEAEKLGIDIRAVVEKALEEEIRRAKFMRFKKLVEEALKNIDTTVEEWIKAVKEVRIERQCPYGEVSS